MMHYKTASHLQGAHLVPAQQERHQHEVPGDGRDAGRLRAVFHADVRTTGTFLRAPQTEQVHVRGRGRPSASGALGHLLLPLL